MSKIDVTGTMCADCKMWDWDKRECNVFTKPYFVWKKPKREVCWGHCPNWDEYNRRMDACAKYTATHGGK